MTIMESGVSYPYNKKQYDFEGMKIGDTFLLEQTDNYKSERNRCNSMIAKVKSIPGNGLRAYRFETVTLHQDNNPQGAYLGTRVHRVRDKLPRQRFPR